ncbi:MAG TPA: HD domain-containing phosphohydrolase [Pirellulales bacterium]|jgi:putative nucleotidyltransferase with HDIG domain|nr:HD domain-containing phosphohydrolase [Pirellulales bacterium]
MTKKKLSHDGNVAAMVSPGQETGGESAPKTGDRQRSLPALCQSLEKCFGAKFTLVDVITGDCQVRGNMFLAGQLQTQLELCRALAHRGKAEFIAEEEPVVVLAIPLLEDEPTRYVALAPFLVHRAAEPTIVHAVTTLGGDANESKLWAVRQHIWDAGCLLNLAELASSHCAAEFRAGQMQREIYEISSHLASAYEELSLLYGLTQKLKISASIEDLGQKALEWLAEAISAEGFVLQLLPVSESEGEMTGPSQRQSAFLQFGHCAIDRFQFSRLVEHLGLNEQKSLLVINAHSRGHNWPLPHVQQAVIVPLTEGENLFGWLAAFNREEHSEFGTSEASLLSSVAAILGIHAGNLELYRQQAEFLAGVVRALTSAIDAKDPYTCGHSDRVARIAMELANEIGCGHRELETLYLSGLLHDIGKIGIDDQVLRKPGKLTQGEYEHIKLHAEIGYRILKDLKQLDLVLPVVRHHHESWDGSGYPMGLAQEEIPLFARIVAVADAFDAMSSDRPYRKGMPDEKLDAILREGAGTQWDPEVIEAFFAVRDKIRRIEHSESKTAPVSELALMT